MMRDWLKPRRVGALMLVGAGLLGHAQAQQDLRDPTVPPPMSAVAPDAPVRSPLGVEGMSVIVRDGKAGLVVGTRVVQPGQKLGSWVLERITETDIWLRDGTNVRKVSRFSGIERHDPAQVPVCALPTAVVAQAKQHSGKTVKVAPAPKQPPASTKADTQCDAPPTRSSNP